MMTTSPAPAQPLPRLPFRSIPRPRFEHLRRMTDHIGLWEHAKYTTPRREHGYCTDDNARALIVVCREPDPSPLIGLARVYLQFLADAALPGGGLHNRRRADGSWGDDVGSDDSQGRAIWALGTAARLAPEDSMRRDARNLFDRQLGFSSPALRANAFAALGAAEVLAADARHEAARAAMVRWVSRFPDSISPEWPWPEPRLTYDNARIPEAMLTAGNCLLDQQLLATGLALLAWLVDVETDEGHFCFTPVGGWGPGEPRAQFDQQPVEAGAMAGACARAWDLTGDERWRECVVGAARWLVDANHRHVVLYDFHTGGCCDGLTSSGPNLNQGAESTLSALITLQHALRVTAS